MVADSSAFGFALQPVPPAGPRPAGRPGKGNEKGDEPPVERKKAPRETALMDAFAAVRGP